MSSLNQTELAYCQNNKALLYAQTLKLTYDSVYVFIFVCVLIWVHYLHCHGDTEGHNATDL